MPGTVRSSQPPPAASTASAKAPATEASADWFERAHRVTPGGVNSPVRAFNAVGGTPRFIERATGPYLFDVDGNEYVDLICSWGPLLLGHAHPEVQAAVVQAVRRRAYARLSAGARRQSDHSSVDVACL